MEQFAETEQAAATRTTSGIPLKDPDSIKLFVGQVHPGIKISWYEHIIFTSYFLSNDYSDLYHLPFFLP